MFCCYIKYLKIRSKNLFDYWDIVYHEQQAHSQCVSWLRIAASFYGLTVMVFCAAFLPELFPLTCVVLLANPVRASHQHEEKGQGKAWSYARSPSLFSRRLWNACSGRHAEWPFWWICPGTFRTDAGEKVCLCSVYERQSIWAMTYSWSVLNIHDVFGLFHLKIMNYLMINNLCVELPQYFWQLISMVSCYGKICSDLDT